VRKHVAILRLDHMVYTISSDARRGPVLYLSKRKPLPEIGTFNREAVGT
jgi:hypothetical protein